MRYSGLIIGSLNRSVCACMVTQSKKRLMPNDPSKKHSQSLSDLLAKSKRLREKSAKLNAEISKLDELIADEAGELIVNPREKKKRG